MKFTRYLWSSLLLVSISTAAKPVLPEAFQGRWNTTCQRVDDVDFMDMSDQVFSYWEEVCDVKANEVTSPTEISVHLHCRQNDGAEFETKPRYKIVNKQLVITNANAPSFSRIRCHE